MSGFDLDAALDLAQRAAAHAGAALKAHRETWSGVEAVLGREVKVAADKHAEGLILEMITKESAIPILSEEAGWVGDGGGAVSKNLAWAVDPLDGSVNYIQGYPHCAVSIALMRGRTPVLGVVDCFLLNERFAGAEGRGAWLNGVQMQVSEVDDPARGILNTGIPARAALAQESFTEFVQDLLAWRKVRMIGSAAAALAYVAAGRADAYAETGAMLWDVAAGCALVKAAGGIVNLEGDALDQPLRVRAANARLAAKLGMTAPAPQ